MKRLINLSVEVEDNDYAEQKFYNWAEDNINPKYIRTTLNTEHLRENPEFKKLMKQKKELGVLIHDFIINNKKK